LPKYKLLVGSDAFRRQAQADMGSARGRLYVQAMTFEGDAAGVAISQAILGSAAAVRRVLVDDYTRFVVSDRFVYSAHYLLDPDFRAEVKATRKMFDSMMQAGVGVRVTNPAGPLLGGFPFRNHKKLIVADNVSYIGGINFSDHNFAWHDLMLRIDDEATAERLAADFEDTYASRLRSWIAELGDMKLYGFDGGDNHMGFAEIITEIDAASREITIVSPYLTFPFVDALERARRRGLAIRLITPLKNNKPIVRDYLLWTAERAGFEVHLTAEMIHLKGMLIDGEKLVLGSSNFDFVSFHVEEELVAVISNPELIADFETRVIAPLLADALPADACRPTEAAGRRCLALLKTAERILSRDGLAQRRSIAWRS
jgi:cardiolipin synthase A/B